MANSKTEDLFDLIKSLTKAEKRSFRLFAERIASSQDLNYMKLFDVVDKMKLVNDEDIQKKMGKMNQTQYSNVKRHLYEQILISLRLVHKTKKIDVRIREMIDFTYLLYGKGLHMQALKIIARAKRLANQNQKDMTLLTIMEVEKMIHSRHITRSKSKPIEQLVEESESTVNSISNRVKLSNLRITMHKFYIENGHVKNIEEEVEITRYFDSQIDKIEEKSFGQMEKVHLYQSYVWYYYILNDFENCHNYARKWVGLFEDDEEFLSQDVNLYFRANHYLLTSLYNLKDKEKYSKHYLEFEEYRKRNYGKFNKNTQILSFLYVHQARLNYHFLNESFDVGVTEIRRTTRRLDRYKHILDEHKVMVFYFKIAWMYLRNKQAKKSIKYLQYIIDLTNETLRIDIQAYARLMFLMAHYDLGNRNILSSLARNYNHYFTKHNIQNNVQILFLKYFREISKAPVIEQKQIAMKYRELLRGLEDNKYEKRAFLYLDINSWLEEKI